MKPPAAPSMHPPSAARLGVGVAALLALSLVSTTALAQTSKSKKVRKAAPAAVVDECRWERPGDKPFNGLVPKTLQRYAGTMPPELRAKFEARMDRIDYDDFVEIRRDSIVGTYSYEPEIRDLMFGDRPQVCRKPSRAHWPESMMARGLVYCEGQDCIVVSTELRNVGRITRRPEKVLSQEVEVLPAQLPAALPPVAISAAPPSTGGGDSPSFGPAPSGALGTPSLSFPSPGGGSSGLPFTPILNPTTPTTPIPEPGSWALIGLGLAGLAVFTRRRKPRD
ncbi:MHFG family PEP-CTERM protein [Aquariibacter lacus]